MSAAEILVIILSVVLAFFLVLGIVLVVYLIIIAKKIRRIASSAERTVGYVENIAEVTRKAAAPAALSKLLIDAVGTFTAKNKKSKGDN